MIDRDRLWGRLFELREIGKREGSSVTRLSFTKEERATRERLASYMRAGLSKREDAVGNLFGCREGRDPEAPTVLVGSHMDSVHNGGNFDGPLRLLAGIEALQTMHE
ncbi:MAG: hypothetical protein JOZ19_16290 [Rubrobacter sp.]|nr:hypothetical protein [Rubrobacter sp.]